MEEAGQQRLQRRVRNKSASSRTAKKTFDDFDLESDVEEAKRRLARFDWQLEQQRQSLKRRKKKGEDTSLDLDVLAPLVEERADLLSRLEEMDLEGSERRQLMESCEGQQKALEQLCVDALSTSDLDPSALLAEARRRFELLESKAKPSKVRAKLKLENEVAEAARRLAHFEEELESQRLRLARHRKASKEPRDGVLAGHALLHQSALEELRQQRDACQKDCESLQQVSATWSSEQKAACRELEEKCSELSELWGACCKAAEGMAPAVDAAVAEAMRRVARFDEELEKQRLVMRRRKAPVEDVVLTKLLEEKKAAMAECEEMKVADFQRWHEVESLWKGKLSGKLQKLAKVSTVDTSEAMMEAQKRLLRIEEESEQQRLALRRRKPKAQAQREELERLAESGTHFEDLAKEHGAGLQEQQGLVKELMAGDREAIEAIESWRQMAGLEELQSVAHRMQEQLAPLEVGQEPLGEERRVDAETEEAKRQCSAMQARLRELRVDEEERQRLLLTRRKRRPKEEPAAEAELEAVEMEENSRELLMKAHERIAEGDVQAVQALREQLHDLREVAFTETKEEPPEAPTESVRVARAPPKEELAAAMAASEERIDLVNRMGADLLAQLEAVFCSDTLDMEEAVLAAVDSWRGRLPREAPELGGHLERMDLAARKAAEANSEHAARQAFLSAWKDRLSHVAEASEGQALQQAQALRARAAERHGRRAQAETLSPTRRSLPAQHSRRSQAETSSPSRRSLPVRQPTLLAEPSEVQSLLSRGKSFAESFCLQAEEEEEEQARRLLRLTTARRSASRPGTALPSPGVSPQRGLARTMTMTSKTSWARSTSRFSRDSRGSSTLERSTSPLSSASVSTIYFTPTRRFEIKFAVTLVFERLQHAILHSKLPDPLPVARAPPLLCPSPSASELASTSWAKDCLHDSARARSGVSRQLSWLDTMEYAGS